MEKDINGNMNDEPKWPDVDLGWDVLDRQNIEMGMSIHDELMNRIKTMVEHNQKPSLVVMSNTFYDWFWRAMLDRIVFLPSPTKKDDIMMWEGLKVIAVESFPVLEVF